MTGTTQDSNGRGVQRTIDRAWDASTPPSMALVQAVADERDAEPTDLRPLYEVVDTDALDALVRTQGVTMSVAYEGYVATINGDGRLELVEQKDGA